VIAAQVIGEFLDGREIAFESEADALFDLEHAEAKSLLEGDEGAWDVKKHGHV
jgi:hypothetical protein